jgi:hypothetical protein
VANAEIITLAPRTALNCLEIALSKHDAEGTNNGHVMWKIKILFFWWQIKKSKNTPEIEIQFVEILQIKIKLN